MSQLTTICCGECGIEFAVPESWRAAREGDGRTFYCPNGHNRVYRETVADKLRRERDLLKQQLAQKDDEIKWQKDQRQASEKRVSAAKGQITKLKKRAKAGTCPCCKRTFSNMAEHMRTQHPKFDPNVVDFDAEKTKRA